MDFAVANPKYGTRIRVEHCCPLKIVDG